MTRRVFTTTGWNQTGDPVDLGVIDGVQTISYLSIDKAAAACVDRDVVEPCRPGMPGFSFYDADGNPLKTVVVPLGANWVIYKAITIQGGWCRLRLDGEGTRWASFRSPNGVFSDIDACNLKSADSTFLHGSNQTFNRCVFANVQSAGMSAGLPAIIRDSAILGSTTGYNGLTFTRCSLYMQSNPAASAMSDCVSDASGASFVKSKGVAGSVTNWNDWETTCDLRLLPSSPYASGATSVQSGQEVYDVAGNKRKVGGALGAYEVLDDAPTHYPCATTPGWRYTATRDDDSAPTVLNHCVYANADGSTVRQLELPNAATVERENSGAWSRVGRGTVIRTTLSATARLFRATYDSTPTDDSSFCYIQEYSPDQTTAEGYSNATPCKMKWTDGRFFLDGNKAQITSANGAPDSSSVVYLGENKLFSDDARGVGKIIQEGFVHTDLGGAEGEIILGRDSTAKTSGKLTWSGQTTTSAEALARLTPRAPAELTFKECDITDA